MSAIGGSALTGSAITGSELSVLLFSDEPMCRFGIQAALARPGFSLAGFCETPTDLISAIAARQPHALIFSVAMDPELNLLAELRRVAPSTAVILLAREFTPELAHHGMELGVRGFLCTTVAPEGIPDCIRLCAHGQLWMERSLYSSLLDARPAPLSRRQTELLTLLIQGLKNREIATSMGISEGTVKSYLTKLFEKVGARDRFELALYGLKNIRTAPEAELERDTRIRAHKRSALGVVA